MSIAIKFIIDSSYFSDLEIDNTTGMQQDISLLFFKEGQFVVKRFNVLEGKKWYGSWACVDDKKHLVIIYYDSKYNIELKDNYVVEVNIKDGIISTLYTRI